MKDAFRCPRLMRWISLLLEGDEREAVLGDLAEEKAGGWSSIVSIFGLILRRELTRWGSPLSWVVMLGVLIPCVLMLIVVGRYFAHLSAIYVWMFANNSDWELLRQAGFWSGVWEFLPGFVLAGLALLSWSWCCGYAIGSASRLTVRANSVLICMLIGAAVLGWTPSLVHVVLPRQPKWYAGNAVVFRNLFYREVYPKLTLVLLVLIPLLGGIYQACRKSRALAWQRVVSTLVIGVALLSLAAQTFAPRLPVFAFLQVGVVGVAAYLLVRPWPHKQTVPRFNQIRRG